MISRLVGVALLALSLAACDRGAKPGSAPGPDQTYTVRGRIERLPGAEGAMVVHHEAIPEFVGKDGRVVGMREMSMEFPQVAPDAGVEGVEAGQGVNLTFEVRWDATPRTRVTRVEVLPDGTALNLRQPEDK